MNPKPFRPRPSRLAPRRRAAAAALAAAALLGACAEKDHLAAGRELLAKGDDAAAVIELRNAVSQDPRSAEARVLLAGVLERRYDLAGAEEHLRKALDDGGKAEVLVPRIALLMLDRGDNEALVRRYQGLRLEDRDADAALRGAVALAMLALGRDEPARDQIEGEPDVATVRLARAQLLVRQGQTKEALALLRLDDAASPPPWWLLRAARRIANAAGEPALALQLIDRARQAAPWHMGTLGEYGEALVSAGRFDDAAKVRDRLAKEAPRTFWAHYLSALLHNAAGRTEEAHAAALAVLKVAPEHVASSLLAASAELRRGDLAMADKRLGALVQKNPALVPALRLLAQAQLRQGRGPEAAETLQRGLRLAPGDPEMLMLRARIEAAAGQFKAMAATYAELAAKRPDDPEILLPLAQARFAMGDKAGARSTLERLQGLVENGAQGARLVDALLTMRETEWARRTAGDLVARFAGDPQARLALAATMSAQGDAAGAWTATLAVLDDKPANTGALMALAAMTRTPAQRQELMARHARALEAGGGGPQQLLDYAALLRFGPGGTQTPQAVLERGVKLYPTAVVLRRELVQELLRAGQAERATNVAQQGAATVDAPAEAQELLGRTYVRLGKLPQAAEVYRKLAAEFPQRADWRLELARLEADTGRIDQATQQLHALVTERPFDLTPYLALAQLAARSNVDEALSVARQLAAQPQLEGAGLLLAGDIYLGAGKPTDALEKYNAAAKAGDEPNATLRVIALLDRTERRDAAEGQLAAAMRRFPDSPAVLGFAARRAQAAGKPAQAVEYLQRLARKSPNNPVLLNDLAWAQLAADRPEALANARRALAAMPNDPNVLHTAGLAYARNGKHDEAIAALRAAANLAPTRALPKLDLARSLADGGDKPGAAAALRGLDEAQLGTKDRQRLAELKGRLGPG